MNATAPGRVDGFDVRALAFVLIVAAWSAQAPYNWPTWWMEVTPALAGMVILAVLYPRWRFCRLTVAFIALHMMILFVGGHYTYARVPLFDWIRDWCGGQRNDFDRVGHFAQGFVPALIAREILLRRGVLARPGWVSFLVACICLALSASYELIEWTAAVILGQGADDFLGTQGDPWDTQKDMLTAFIGAWCALLFFYRWQDRSMAKLAAR